MLLEYASVQRLRLTAQDRGDARIVMAQSASI